MILRNFILFLILFYFILDESIYPSRKERHYDSSEVKVSTTSFVRSEQKPLLV